jgi:hypothetical protein
LNLRPLGYERFAWRSMEKRTKCLVTEPVSGSHGFALLPLPSHPLADMALSCW